MINDVAKDLDLALGDLTPDSFDDLHDELLSDLQAQQLSNPVLPPDLHAARNGHGLAALDVQATRTLDATRKPAVGAHRSVTDAQPVAALRHHATTSAPRPPKPAAATSLATVPAVSPDYCGLRPTATSRSFGTGGRAPGAPARVVGARAKLRPAGQLLCDSNARKLAAPVNGAVKQSTINAGAPGAATPATASEPNRAGRSSRMQFLFELDCSTSQLMRTIVFALHCLVTCNRRFEFFALRIFYCFPLFLYSEHISLRDRCLHLACMFLCCVITDGLRRKAERLGVSRLIYFGSQLHLFDLVSCFAAFLSLSLHEIYVCE